MVLLKSNQALGEKYLVAVKKIEVLGEAEEMDQQRFKFKVAVTETSMEQISRGEENKNKSG